MDPLSLLDRYALENIPGIADLDVDGSPLDHEVFLYLMIHFFQKK